MTRELTRRTISRNRLDAIESLTHALPQSSCDQEVAPLVYYMGQRVYFRPIEFADEPLLRRWINDPRVWQYLVHRGPQNEFREREWIEAMSKSKTDYVFGIVAKDEDRLIGVCGLHHVDAIKRSALFGISIGETAYQSRGYGSDAVRLCVKYAFRELNLNRVELGVLANNWRAIQCYQKVGFVHEGCCRQAFFRGGEYVDEYRFAILREEWESVPTVVNEAYRT